MTVLQALVLGIVQGLGEFLPISSSAHLVLVPWVFKWQDPGLSFDVALHMGTLVAVVAFFWRDWARLITNGLLRKPTRDGSLFWYLVIATVPGALSGFFLEKQAETVFRNPVLIGIMLIVMGIALYWVDRKAARRKQLYGISLADSLFIGFLQALAIIPGVSRSGITMTAGRFRGLTRETAARFSFLLSTPIIFGAGVAKLDELSAGDLNAAFITGVVSSAVVGFMSIGFLLRYLTERSFVVFVWYRFVVGIAVITLALVRTAGV
ncbi:undecaprenyl-diphosphate phosphatase [Pelotomaculum terephthalicicum JT]|uniref:undecaprenyl-diphosphate phosphatase n=1 Tax=Pelotomaculum TaxID=191373 RepID=UPI001F034E52|nr:MULTISPECIES: undecaprenyl-diphosphate phosphatase [Pelotomaculum]MCG9969722.1 undecaprenyl-diphosphate phosphatase [Pelotomaculum terephthalicicum JT]